MPAQFRRITLLLPISHALPALWRRVLPVAEHERLFGVYEMIFFSISPFCSLDIVVHLLIAVQNPRQQLHFERTQLIALAPQLRTLPVPLVIDHLGRIDPAEGPAAQAYGVVRGLLDGGNTWVKLSGAYMRSTVHGPSYADTLPLGQALVQAAPERLVWGSDWPHTTETPGTVKEVKVRKGRWFWRNPSHDRPAEEITLSDDERREFAQWCKERAAKLRKQADDTEARYAGAADV